jgi:hypothetical protein
MSSADDPVIWLRYLLWRATVGRLLTRPPTRRQWERHYRS